MRGKLNLSGSRRVCAINSIPLSINAQGSHSACSYLQSPSDPGSSFIIKHMLSNFALDTLASACLGYLFIYRWGG